MTEFSYRTQPIYHLFILYYSLRYHDNEERALNVKQGTVRKGQYVIEGKLFYSEDGIAGSNYNIAFF